MSQRESSMIRPAVEKLAFTIPEAAAVSSIGQTSLYKAIRDKQLKARKYGTRTIITRIDLQAFLDSLPSSDR
jgi:excisionase family DNA binding protein